VPSAPGEGVAPSLEERLRGEADRTGFLPFDRFMELALYAPRVGYYARPRSPLGPRGDYYTAAHASPLFGRALAAKLRSVREEMEPGPPFRIVELGPGDGALGAEVLRALASGEGASAVAEYVVIDRSEPRLSSALDRIREAARGSGIPVRSAPSISALGVVAGAIVANELLDAQPVRRLVWTGDAWTELGVRLDGGRLVSAEGPVTAPVPAPALPAGAEPGTILEVSPAAEGIVREAADHLVAGRLLVADYGMEEAELLRGHPSGTLAGVRDHRAVADPLDRPGEVDLSVFVNFTRIRAAARSAGFTEVSFSSQAEALGAWGFPRLLEEAVAAAPSEEERVRLRLASKSLLFGFDRFRVLELAPRRREGPTPG
jgi:SAM-dependent MidA family methyltransferase